MVEDLLARSIEPCKKALADAGIDASKVDEVVMVGGQTRMPAIQNLVEEFFGKESHRGVNPDEVVAIGAAIQGGVLRGDVKDVLLLDVTPLSLGIETLGGVFTKLIDRNTTIPTNKSEIFSTAADNQNSVEVHVLQGEREMSAGNNTLGRFHLVGIPPAPRGVPQVEVSFDIDANGIVKVSAKDLGTGKEQNITITASSGLAEDEISRMVDDAESHAQEDKDRRQAVEARNQLDGLVYSTEKGFEEHREKLGDAEKAEFESALEQAKKALEGEDVAAIEQATAALQQASHKLAEVMYAQPDAGAAAEAAADGAAPPAEDGDEVIDAEYVDVDEQAS
jgi:molecular chaperone DnaK